MRLIALLMLIATTTGAAIRFDGSDDVLHYVGPGQLLFTNSISISFWCQKEAGIGTAAEFLGKGRVLNGNVSHFQVRNNSGKFDWYCAAPITVFHIWTTTGTFNQTNVPIHVAFAFNYGDSNSMRCWVNGVREAGAWTASAVNFAGVTNNEPMRIGATYSGSTVRGQVWEVAIWNDYLNDDEVLALSSRNKGVPLQIRRNPEKLAGYWPLDREFPFFTTASGSNAVLDASGFGQHMTPLNSPQSRPSNLIDQ